MQLVSNTQYPPMERRLRLGFVGGGQGAFIGAVHANGARLSNRWETVAGALSSNPERARTSGKEWFFAPDRIYTDYEEMAIKEAARPDGIECVTISTPNHLHYPVAKAFMKAGIDVICDKPVTASLDEALDLVRLRRETGVFFGVSYPFIGNAMVRQAKAMVKAGMLGDIRQIHVEYFQEWAIDVADDGSVWRMDPEQSGKSFTIGDIGVHAFNLAEFVADKKITEVMAFLHVCGQPKRMEDTAYMQLRLDGDIPGTLMISQVAAGHHGGLQIRLFGTKAGLSWHQENPELLYFTPLDAPTQIYARGYGAGILEEARCLTRMPRGHPEALTDAWANIYTEFALVIDARRHGKSLPLGMVDCPSLDHGVRGMAFVEAALQSHEQHKWAQVVVSEA